MISLRVDDVDRFFFFFFEVLVVVPAGMVWGVTLAPGERVIYYHREDVNKWQRIAFIVLGVLLLIGIIGIVFLLIGITMSTTVYVVTTRRFIKIDGKTVEEIRHEDVKEVTREVAGSILKWIKISDGKRVHQSWQVQANPPDMPDKVLGWLKDPSSVERAENAWHDNLPTKEPWKVPQLNK